MADHSRAVARAVWRRTQREAGDLTRGAATTKSSTSSFDPETIRYLRESLGGQLVAYIASQRSTRAVIEWVASSSEPESIVMQRLLLTAEVVAMASVRADNPLIQAWFQGKNPVLNDVSVARYIREGTPDETWRELFAAARKFLADE